jgi:hypothetical protein
MNDELEEKRQNDRPVVLVAATLIIAALSLGLVALIKSGPHIVASSQDDVPIFSVSELRSNLDNSPRITALIAVGMLHEIHVSSYGIDVVIGPQFSEASFEDKVAAMQLLAAIVGPTRGGDRFRLYDWRDHEKVGAWSKADGLELHLRN